MQKETNMSSVRREREEKADEIALQADISAFEGRYEDAERLYEEALKHAGENADLWAFRGINMGGGLGKLEEAKICWERAERLDPEIGIMMKERVQDQSMETAKRLSSLRNLSCRSRVRGLMEEIERDSQ